MQTTLLGLAIAFILAMLAALIGPYFVDWNEFRPQFEAEATRVLGAQVRVTGAMDARLLPVPSLRLKSVAIGGANDPGRLSADRFDVEFSLGALMRGEVRASELTVNGVSVDLGIDEKGQIDWPAIGRFDGRSLAIEKFNITGRIALHDAASKSTVELEDIAFAGDIRGASALRGDGNFTLTGTRYPFRLSTSSTGDQLGTRTRFTVDASAVPLAIDLDGLVTMDARRPRFDGTLVLARPARVKAGDPLPWRTVTKLKADPSGAALEQIDVTAGADDGGLKLTGSGDMRFGALPFLRATLAAKSLDGDRLLGTSGTAAALLPGLADALAALPQIPFAADITTSVEQIMLAGRPVQDIGVELRSAGRGWSVSRLDFRGPGATRVSLAGAFTAAQASGFDGRINLVSNDPDAFANWLQGRGDTATRLQKPLKIGGQLKLAPGRIALDGMTAEIDGGTVKGRFVLARPEKGPSRIEAALQADRLDIDAAVGMLKTLSTGRDGWPDEGQVALDIGRAMASGQEMKPFGLAFAYDAQRVTLERLRVGEASGVTLDGSGAFDRKAATGTVSLNAATPSLARLAALVEPMVPQMSARIASLAKDDGPARLSLSLGLDNDAAKPERVKARASLGIDSTSLKGALTLNATPQAAMVRALDFDKLPQSDLAIEGKLAAPRGRTLAALLGFDGMLAVGDAPLTLDTSVTGAWSSSWRGSAKLTGASLEADVQGSIEPFLGQNWAEPRAAALRVALRKANIAPLLGLSADDPLARDVSLTSKLTVAGNQYIFDGIDGVVGGARLRGRTAITWQDVKTIDGEIGLDRVDLAPAFGVAIGSIGHDANEPLGNGWLRGWRGRMGFVALRGVMPGGLEVQTFSGALRNDGDALVLEGLKAKLGGGEATGEFEARPGVAGLALTGQMQLANVEGNALTYRGLAMPAGKTALRLSLASQGRSAAALASAVSGEGLVALTPARFAGLNPKAIEAAVIASDQSKIGDDAALRRIVEPALASATVSFSAAQIPFVIKDGRLRVNATLLEAPDARAVISGGYDFMADQADYRATLSAPNLKGVGNSLPELQVFAVGPSDRMVRAIDIAPLSSWLAIRAIDRETRRLDALERTPPPSVAAVPADPAPPPQDTVPAAAPVPQEAAPPPPKPRTPRVMPQPVPQANAQTLAPALPPAIDIGPPPGVPRAVRPRPPMPLTPALPRVRTLDAFQ